MAISGNLADFSLPEIFQFLDRGSKTGLLKIRGLFENETFRYSYIWLDHGRVVAMSDRLDRKGLSNMIERRGWFKNLSSPQDFASSSLDMPLGLHLKSLGVLQTEQLKMLFRASLKIQTRVGRDLRKMR
ncbi:DUF4388 domain-containing protein [Tumidithrix elongata RA019]|uniref:DUF4388 domain-containing protein n=1 Tax=Tumidithrix elongata BACA0141 TaxID=2716417 RepID=A0AAW9QA39_9CYAN|nr:DUF4388 domain-containing protein [Tumidithrix elongata RA019]